MEIDPDEYEWLVFSEKMFRMIVMTHDCTRDFISRPIWFESYPNPVEKNVKFYVKYRSVTQQYKTFSLILNVEDYSLEEIAGRIKLAHASSEVYTPGGEL